MYTQNIMSLTTQLLLIAGALNWGMVAFNNTDVVKMLVGGFHVYIKYIVAFAGVYALYDLTMNLMTPQKETYKVRLAKL